MFEIDGLTVTSLVRSEITYGLMSRLRVPSGTSSPTTVAAREYIISPSPVPLMAGTRVRNDDSFFHRLLRSA